MRLSAVIVAVLALLVATTAFAQKSASPAPSLKIDGAEFVASSSSEGYSLNGGKGDRTFIETVSFDQTFTEAPKVLVTISGFDATADEKMTTRVQVSATKITKSGFTLRVKTWGDGRVGAVWGTWVAIGK